MRLLLLALTLACGAAYREQDKFKRGGPPDLVAPMPIHWIKLYPLTPYKAHWTYEVEVKSFDKAIAAMEKLGLRPTQPLDLFPQAKTERQVSFRGSFKQAQAADKRLRRIGKVTESRQRPVTEPVTRAEIEDKIAKLSAEKAAGGEALAKLPSVAAVVDELLGHLLSVKALQERTDSEVLLNMTLYLKP